MGQTKRAVATEWAANGRFANALDSPWVAAIDLDHKTGRAIKLGIFHGRMMRCRDETDPRQSRGRTRISRQVLHRNLRALRPFDAHLDQTGISLTLHRTGDTETRRSVHMHFHYALFADILRDLAKTVSAMPLEDTAHRETVREAAKALYLSLDDARGEGCRRRKPTMFRVQAGRRGAAPARPRMSAAARSKHLC